MKMYRNMLDSKSKKMYKNILKKLKIGIDFDKKWC